ncbi:MAG: hypothetical protein HGA69_00370 [Desulfobulbaceae bacterium]|nr:hypothetical protein [Desulfobulbaceae bacterium]
MLRDEYYQHLYELYSRHGEEALEDFRGELSSLARRRKAFFVTKGRPRSRWTEHDGEREEVLISFLADIEARKQLDIAEKSILKKVSKNATDAKYAAGHDRYIELLKLAEGLWKSGDKRTHDKMLNHLVGKEGIPPGISKEFHYLKKFDSKCGYTRNGLRNKLKELAYKIDPNLVCGLKKKL